MRFYALGDKDRKTHLRDVELEWRDFASKVNAISNAGLDGPIDILHQSAYLRGAQAVEVEVNTDRTDVIDVHPVIPKPLNGNWKNGAVDRFTFRINGKCLRRYR